MAGAARTTLKGVSPAALCLVAFLACVLSASPAPAADWVKQGPVLSVIEENDVLFNTDRHYTQGFKISFLHEDDYFPPFAGWAKSLSDAIPRLGFERQVDKFGYTFGQSIFTPTDLRATQLLKDDRPYAGWWYTGLILQRRGMLAGRIPVQENFQVDLGVIGRHSFAQEVQTGVHEWRGFDVPKGWGNQLHDEPGIALKYERSWLFSPTGSGTRWLDVIPHAGMSLGNVETAFRIGTLLRFGYNMPNDFGVETISSLTTPAGGRPPKADRNWKDELGFYIFGGGEASTVLYTAFLDGNMFRSSHSVEKEYFVAEWKIGVVFVLNAVELGFSYVYRTPQFVDQRKNDVYGSVSLKARF